jgi:hypothetical protein
MGTRTASSILALASTVLLAGCPKEEGPLEKAGKQLDDAAEGIGDAAQDAAKEVEKVVEGDH